MAIEAEAYNRGMVDQYWQRQLPRESRGREYLPDVYLRGYEALRLLSDDPTPHFIVSDADLAPLGSAGSLALVKAAAFASRVIVITGPCEHWRPQGLYPPTAKETWYGNRLASTAISDLERKMNDPHYSSVFTLVPISYEYWEEDWQTAEAPGRAAEISQGRGSHYHFENEYTKSDALKVSFQSPFVAAQLLERNSDLPSISVDLWLPILNGISLDDVLRVRADEGDAFDRLHFSIQQFMAELRSTESEEVLKAVLQHMHFEIKEYAERLRAIKRRAVRSLGEAVISGSVMGGSLLLPQGLAEMIMAVIGTVSIREISGKIFDIRTDLSGLRKSDYYAIARLADAGKKRNS